MKKILLCAVAVLCQGAWADGDRRAQPVENPAYRQECGACHVAYPPGLLPAVSWQRLMDNLTQHFGSDASLDPKQLAGLRAWLVANAGKGPAPPQDRLTRGTWFVHEHDDVPPSTWQRADVKSAANCSACHLRAEQGDFSERHLRIPR